MTSLVSTSNSFSSLTAPGDAITVLVLVETSSAMLNLWDEIKNFYLPALLETLRNAHDPQTVSMQVWWQTSQNMHSGNQHSSNATLSSSGENFGNEIPDFQFDPASTSAISTTALLNSIETLKAAFPVQRATRHFILVAATPLFADPRKIPSSSTIFQSIAFALHQERIRFHMILGPGQHMQPYHQLHQQALHMQNLPLVPLWFRADTSKFNVLLMGGPPPSSPEGVSSRKSPAVVPGNSQSPASTSSTPSSPTFHDASSPERRKSASPQTRQGRPGTLEQPTHGLVSYLQQMHGLTKKRTYGGGAKAAKRATTNNPPRASSSTRAILPRLDLSDQRPRGYSPYPMVSPATERPASDVKAASSSRQRYIPIAPASSSSSPSEDDRQSRHRWPWLRPVQLPSMSCGPSSATRSAVNALCTLASIPPRNPDLASQLPDLGRGLGSHRAQVPQRAESGYDLPSSDSSSQLQRLPADWYSRQQSPPTNPHSVLGDHRMSVTPSPTHARTSWLPTYPHVPGYPPHDYIPQEQHEQHVHHTYPHVIPPSHPIPQQNSTSDPEDQPFLLTPEFEAMADAHFEHALRSGAIEASMTSATLGPAAASPLVSTRPIGINTSNPMGQRTPLPYPVSPQLSSVAHLSSPSMPPPTQVPDSSAPRYQVYQGYQTPTTWVPTSGYPPPPDPAQGRWYGP